MELPTTPPRKRPAPLRTYGKKRETPLFPLLPSPPGLTRSDSLKSSDGSFGLPSSDLGLGGLEDMVRIRGSSPVGEDEIAGKEENQGGLRWVKKEPVVSPRPSLGVTASAKPIGKIRAESKASQSKGLSTASPGQSTLRAFFAPKPRVEPSLLTTGHSLRTEAQVGPSSSAPRNKPVASSTSRVSGDDSNGSVFKPQSSSSSSTKLRQLYFRPTASKSGLTTCKKCNFSYLRGEAESEDEVMHKRHCERVIFGSVWEGKGYGKEVEVGEEVGFERRQAVGKRYKGMGRIVQVDGAVACSNTRISEILSSVDTVLSAPALPVETLKTCQIFLFLTSSPAPPILGKRLDPGSISARKTREKGKERVVGCVVTQGIRWGMRIVDKTQVKDDAGEETAEGQVGKRKRRVEDERDDLVLVGNEAEGSEDGGVLCYPERHPVRLGVHRIFTVPAYRGCGIVRSLLDQACQSAIYGYKCDPIKGDVAFSQPTQSGKRVMDTWGHGRVLVFNEDEQDDDLDEAHQM